MIPTRVINNGIPVLFVLPTLGTGGSERVVFNLCNNLSPQFSPIVASFRDGALYDEMKRAGIRVYLLNRKSGLDLTLTTKLQEIIKREKVRIVNSHHFVSLFYAIRAARHHGIPLMHTEHSRWEMEQLSPFWNFCFKFLLKKVHLVNAVSEATFSYLKDVYHLPDSRLALTPNGIDVDLFENAESKADIRRSIGITDQDTVIGNVGNHRREKNQGLLIKAVSLLKNKGRDIRLVLVGDGPCRLELENLAAGLGVREQVIFLGVRDDAQRLYGAFDIYCLTSRYEGLPLTILESMAAGIPVIGTDVLGIRDLINDGENGLLSADDDVKTLSRVIEVLLSDNNLREKLSKNGRILVRDNFSLERSITSYKILLEMLLSD